jgi:hypothetical protein
MYLIKYGPIYELKSQARFLYRNTKCKNLRNTISRNRGDLSSTRSRMRIQFTRHVATETFIQQNNIIYKKSTRTYRNIHNFGHGAANLSWWRRLWSGDILPTRMKRHLGTIGKQQSWIRLLQNDRDDTYPSEKLFGNISLSRWNGTGWN